MTPRLVTYLLSFLTLGIQLTFLAAVALMPFSSLGGTASAPPPWAI